MPVPDRLDLQRRQHRPHPVADPRRGPLHRRGPALRARRDRRPAGRPAGDDAARLRAGAAGRAGARRRALPLRARRATRRLMREPPSDRRRRAASGEDGASAADYGKTASFLAIGVGLTGAHHLRLLPDRLARPLQARLRADHGALVGGLHHRLDPLPADRTAALAPHLRAAGRRASRSASRCGSRRRSSSAWRCCFAVARPGPARADPGRPAGGQRNPLLGLLRRRPLLRRQLLRPRLPRRPAAASASSRR